MYWNIGVTKRVNILSLRIKNIKLNTIYSFEILLILEEDSIKKAENALKKDRGHGTKMVLEQYIKWLDLEDENFAVSYE